MAPEGYAASSSKYPVVQHFIPLLSLQHSLDYDSFWGVGEGSRSTPNDKLPQGICDVSEPLLLLKNTILWWVFSLKVQPVWQWMGHPAHSNFVASIVAVCTKNQRLRKAQRMKLGNYSGFLCCKPVCHLVACCVLSHVAWLCHFYLMLKAPGLNRDSVTMCCFLNYLWLDLER